MISSFYSTINVNPWNSRAYTSYVLLSQRMTIVKIMLIGVSVKIFTFAQWLIDKANAKKKQQLYLWLFICFDCVIRGNFSCYKRVLFLIFACSWLIMIDLVTQQYPNSWCKSKIALFITKICVPVLYSTIHRYFYLIRNILCCSLTWLLNVKIDLC